MEFHCFRIWIRFALIGYLISITGADTRYECIVNLMARGGNPGFGFGGGFEADEFENEIGEMGEMGEADEGGFAGAMMATGSLTCPQGNRGNILVKRVAYGTSMFGSTCRSDSFCKEEYDTADGVADRCDGRSSCFIDMLRPVFLQCGRMSTYMLVEYECVDTWTTFDVCETKSTVARGSSVFITSPGYLTLPKRQATTGKQMCECILQSQNGADIYMDYLQTQLASEGDTCPYEYVMVESKKNITSRKIDKELEVCGRRHVGARWFEGSIRLTYASGGVMQKRGLITKFTADNIGSAPRIELECGPVDASTLTLKERPAAPPKPPGQNPMMPPFPTGPFPPMGTDFSKAMMPPGPMFPSVFPPFGPVMNGSGSMPMFPSIIPPTAFQPDFTNWKIKIPGEVEGGENPGTESAPALKPQGPAKAPKPQQKQAPTKPQPGNKNKKPVRRGGRRPPTGRRKKNKTGKVVDTADDKVAENEVNASPKTGNGGTVGLLFGGIGAALILGSVGILAIHNYRKRQRIKREEAEYYYGRSASSTYGQGWKKEGEEYDSVYATVAEVETYRQGCVNPAVTNDDESSFVNPIKEDHSGKGKGQTKKTSGKPNYNLPEETPPCSYSGSTVSQSEGDEKIAVIEVHRLPEEHITVTYGNDLHSEGCLAAHSYSSIKKNGEDSSRCSECSIVRPPRRRDSDYDNNIGVKKNLKK